MKCQSRLSLVGLSQAHDCAVLRCMCSVEGCPVNTPADFLGGFLQETETVYDWEEKYHQSSDLEECLESQLVFHQESFQCDDEDDAACNSIAIQSSDQQKSRSFSAFEWLLFSLANLLAGMDGSITLLRFRQVRLVVVGIILLHWRTLVAVWEVFWGPSAFKQRTQCLVFWILSALVKYCELPVTFCMLRLRTIMKVSQGGPCFAWRAFFSMVRSEVVFVLLGGCRTSRILHFSSVTTINYPDFSESIAIKTLMFTRIFAKFDDICGIHISK